MEIKPLAFLDLAVLDLAMRLPSAPTGLLGYPVPPHGGLPVDVVRRPSVLEGFASLPQPTAATPLRRGRSGMTDAGEHRKVSFKPTVTHDRDSRLEAADQRRRKQREKVLSYSRFNNQDMEENITQAVSEDSAEPMEFGIQKSSDEEEDRKLPGRRLDDQDDDNSSSPGMSFIQRFLSRT